MTTKKCCTCKEELPITEFHKNRSKKDGYCPQCKKCYKIAKTKSLIKNREKEMLRFSKRRAKEKGLDHNIDVTDIVIPEYCPYFNIKLVNHIGEGNSSSSDDSPTLDRIDPSKGYVKGNVEVISSKANRLKSDGSAEEVMIVAQRFKKLMDERR